MHPEHDAPHAPQLALSTDRFTQALPQTACAKGHVHVPPEQVAPAGHALPQEPQLSRSVCRFAHRPPHNACPVGHTQRPVPHSSPVPHTVPHAPQLRPSDAVSTHWPLQVTRGVAHATHIALTHPCPAEQARPQPPQFLGSENPATSQPSVSNASQSPYPGTHDPTAQRPAVHAMVCALARSAHEFPHAPQWMRLVERSTSQPFASIPSQFPKPTAQRGTHAPLMHVAVLFARVGHTVPQRPQLVADDDRSVSHPLATLPSQSPEPARHAHAPALQVWLTPQARPQAPQLPSSLSVSTQTPPQRVISLGHETSETIVPSSDTSSSTAEPSSC